MNVIGQVFVKADETHRLDARFDISHACNRSSHTNCVDFCSAQGDFFRVAGRFLPRINRDQVHTHRRFSRSRLPKIRIHRCYPIKDLWFVRLALINWIQVQSFKNDTSTQAKRQGKY